MSLTAIQDRIAKAQTQAGRPVGAVTLIAVSKLQPIVRLQQVLLQGHQVFGENYVQETAQKWPALRLEHCGAKVHMIGPLQSNKVKQAMGLFDVIQSVDRPSLATRIARLAQDLGQCPDIFLQVNTGVEAQKAGILPDETDAFVQTCRAMDLPVQGLMCIPPDGQDPSPHFVMLADMAARNGILGLSMGMSADFEAAIAAGATHVRVGSAIFGARPPKFDV